MTSPSPPVSDERTVPKGLRSVIAAVTFVLVLSGPASADQAWSIDLLWRAPAGCPQQEAIRERIQRLVGARRSDGPVRAEGTIVRVGGHFRLQLVVRAGGGVESRSIESASCEDLAGAVAVELALLLHAAAPDSRDGGGEPPPQPRPPAPAAKAEQPPPPQNTGGARAERESTATPPQPAPTDASGDRRTDEIAKPPAGVVVAHPSQVEPPRRWRGLVEGPLIALALGPLPRPALGAGLGLGVEATKWEAKVTAVDWLRQSVPAPDLSGFGADVSRISSTAWGCRRFSAGRLGISPCLTMGVERVSARGTGSNVVPATPNSWGMTVGAGVQARLTIVSRLRLLMKLEGGLELSRPEISIDGLGSIYRLAPAALAIAVGTEWIL